MRGRSCIISHDPKPGPSFIDSRSGDENDNVLSGQLGKVELLLHVVDLDLDIWDGITSLQRRSSGERGESLVGGLCGSGE